MIIEINTSLSAALMARSALNEKLTGKEIYGGEHEDIQEFIIALTQGIANINSHSCTSSGTTLVKDYNPTGGTTLNDCKI